MSELLTKQFKKYIGTNRKAAELFDKSMFSISVDQVSFGPASFEDTKQYFIKAEFGTSFYCRDDDLHHAFENAKMQLMDALFGDVKSQIRAVYKEVYARDVKKIFEELGKLEDLLE